MSTGTPDSVSIFEARSSFWRFARSVQRGARYFRSHETENFLSALLQTAKNRIENIPAQARFYRAQLGTQTLDDDEVGPQEVGLPIKRMKPLLDRATEGRANPKGIPCLYLATTDQTAMAEVRPWDGSTISLALFKTVRPLRIVNCTLGLGRRRRGIRISTAPEEGPSPKEREKRVWRQIDTAFARPVSRSDDLADYVPTQIIAELFKANDFDGLAYRSWLGPGHNLALFDLNAAELVQCAPYEVRTSFRRGSGGVCFKFKQIGNPYWPAARPPKKK